MVRWITREVPSSLIIVATVGVVMAAVALLQRLARRAVPDLSAGEHNEVAGYLIAIVGLLYAVVAGFVVNGQWNEFEEARQNANAEAAALADVVDDAIALDASHREVLRRATLRYAGELIDVEWPAMGVGRRSERAGQQLQELRALVLAALPSTDAGALVVERQLDSVDAAADLRRDRLRVSDSGLPAPMWLILGVGGVLTVTFALLFGLRDQRMYFVMVCSTAVMVALTLVVVALLDYPYAGDFSVRPAALARVQESVSASST